MNRLSASAMNELPHIFPRHYGSHGEAFFAGGGHGPDLIGPTTVLLRSPNPLTLRRFEFSDTTGDPPSTQLTSEKCRLAIFPPLYRAHRKPPPLHIAEVDPLPTKHLPEHPVLLSQVFDRVLLLAVEPTRRGQDEELESLGHPASLPERDAAGEGLVPRALGASAD